VVKIGTNSLLLTLCWILSPLAGSALTNPSLENKRFGLSVLYTLHPSILDAISRLAGVLESESPTLTLPACALRWLTHHSQLDWGVGDGIILGASHTGQIVDNVGAVMEGTLKTRALGAVEILWKEIAHVILASRKTTHELPEGAMSVAIRVWQEGS
jgi:aryl-alcohol dehydrogenase-like predicted oxidoreductase